MSCLYFWRLILCQFFHLLFLYSEGCVSTLFIVSFAMQKLLSLIRSHLFISAFVSFALGERSKKYIAMIYVKSVLAMFSPRNFMISGLTCRNLIHFEFIFV